MFRICFNNRFTSIKSVTQTCLFKEISTKLRFLRTNNSFNLTRHISFKTSEDRISEQSKSERIYYGILTPQIKAVKVFSLSSSIAGLISQPIILKEASTIGSTSLLVALCSVVGFFTFVTPVMLHFITKKYVTEIKYEPEKSTYKATTINFFLAKKELAFKVDDVEVPEVPGMFTTMKAKGIPLFIEARHFNDPVHYAKIMGYDKPMDFKLGPQDADDEPSKVK